MEFTCHLADQFEKVKPETTHSIVTDTGRTFFAKSVLVTVVIKSSIIQRVFIHGC